MPTLPEGASAEDIGNTVELLTSLTQRGFRLAFNQNVLRRGYAQWLPLAAFVKLDMKAFKPEMAAPLVKYARSNTKAELVAEKVETAEQFQLMLDLGVKLFQGFWFAQRSRSTCCASSIPQGLACRARSPRSAMQ